jgi:uncharacterized circularly permuted ATP-grasp superfamily protein
MTLLDEALARYHKQIESPAYQDHAWVKAIQEKMAAHQLMPAGRPVCPVLRPHLVTRRQYDGLAKAAESLYQAIDRARQMAFANPALMARIELLPVEKMLATVDPGYPYFAVTSLLDSQLSNGSLQFVSCSAAGPSGPVYGDALSEVFWDSQPVKELRKKYKLTRMSGMKRLLHALLAAYKVTGKKKFPRIGIVEFRPPFKNTPSNENLLLAEHLRRAGYPSEVVTPDQLEYRNGALCRGEFGIEIVYRCISAQELLVRFDLNHPLVRAYREGAVCMVNSFRTELAQKKALFGLLTDETVTASFPAHERKAIRDHIPWTRLVTPGKTSHNGQSVDLIEFIQKNREKLVMKPNDPSSDLHSYQGSEMDDAAWERALKSATRQPYVVQERVEPSRAVFPVSQFGRVELRQMDIDVQPHIFLGKVEGCSTSVSDATSTFSTLGGVAPTFILEGQA